MNRCDENSAILSAYLDGELSDTETKELEIHLQNCQTCAGKVNLLKQMIQACGELEEDLPEGFEASLHERLEEIKKKGTVHKNRNIQMLTRIAAGVVLVLSLGMLIRIGMMKPKMENAKSADQMTAPMTMAGHQAGENSIQENSALMQRSEAPADMIQEKDNEDFGGSYSFSGRSPQPDENQVKLETEMDVCFTEDLSVQRVEGQDTRIVLMVEDVKAAAEAIKDIHAGVDTKTIGRDVPGGTLTAGGGETPLEIKLSFSDDEAWQAFIQVVRVDFPVAEIELIPAAEEQEHIRIVIRETP